jgi:hypothetical protein
MNLETARSFFMWCSIINFSVLILWFALFIFAHNLMKNLSDKVMGCKIESFDTLHYAGISLYKITIIIFNIVPWAALTIIR